MDKREFMKKLKGPEAGKIINRFCSAKTAEARFLAWEDLRDIMG